jgi:hypothetical protein
MAEGRLVAKLRGLPYRVVIHPDTMGDRWAYAEMGGQLVIENMDSRKEFGRWPGELDEVFAELPEAGFCLDVSHACNVGGAELAVDLARRYGRRLGWVHVGCGCGEVCGDLLEDGLWETLGEVLAEVGEAVPVILERKVHNSATLGGQLSRFHESIR